MPTCFPRLVGLAGAAALMGAGLAHAQTPAPTVRPGVPSFNGAPFSGLPSYTNEPGSLQAFFRGRLSASMTVTGDSADNFGGNKSQAYAVGSYARLYPSFEGTTANGLTYGAYLEIRQQAGGQGPSGNTGSATLNFQRETGYVGGSWGTVRFGATDGALSLFTTGTFENFADNWNNDFPRFINSATQVTWPFPNTSGNYGDEKLVYLSPDLAGFDFGASFEPNTVGAGEGNAPTPQSGSMRLSSITGGTFAANAGTTGPANESYGALYKQRNTIEVAGRYRGNLGPVGITGVLGFMTSGVVGNAGLTGTTANGSPQYGMKTPVAANVALTMNWGGLLVGGNLFTGAVNPNGSRATLPVMSGGANAVAYILGTSYAAGSTIVGASYFNVLRQGYNAQDIAGAVNGTVGHMHEWALTAGGTWGWAPGAALSITYFYGQRHQQGVNIYTGGYSPNGVGNDTRAQGVILSNYFVW